jgi:hypothetical protein
MCRQCACLKRRDSEEHEVALRSHADGICGKGAIADCSLVKGTVDRQYGVTCGFANVGEEKCCL